MRIDPYTDFLFRCSPTPNMKILEKNGFIKTHYVSGRRRYVLIVPSGGSSPSAV
jgi:hypothetical protein